MIWGLEPGFQRFEISKLRGVAAYAARKPVILWVSMAPGAKEKTNQKSSRS